MSKYVVIVESPAKTKSLKKYLGKDYAILASYGHVRDLVPKSGAVDPEQNFKMQYQTLEKNAKHVDAIATALKRAEALYLATDPDREGEAIAWHIYEILNARGALENKTVARIVFHEITKSAIKAAVKQPRDLSQALINAQQARRALDFLVGFSLSPLLWKKIRRGLSAGRVQSPALRLIVERQAEIDKFVAQEYWTMAAAVKADEQPFSARLIEYQSEKVTQFFITNAKQAETIKTALWDAAKGKLKIEKIKKSERKRNPAAPFITSTLQQEGVRKLGFSARKTMQIAQQLYEGIDLGGETTGLITYMRTDSVTLSAEALEQIRAYILESYGESALPEAPRVYKTKAKNAQEAHEGIRPTEVALSLDKVKPHLTADQYKLYSLIWKRTVACQMISAVFDLVAVDLLCGEMGRFRANGSTLKIPGFMKVYEEGLDDVKAPDEDKLLPVMKEGDWVDLVDILNEQHFTEPPPKFTEASLVKALEEYGIGRPSTYASIISTLQSREYVTLDKKRFTPTDVGVIVNKFLTGYFKQYVDYDFTAKLEDELDAVARGEKEWIPLLETFWKPFINLIQHTEENVQRKDVTQEKIDETCPKCEQPLSIRLGRRGRFIGCTAYPDCDYTRSLDEGREESLQPNIVEDRKCPKCDSQLIYKRGPYGKFIGCSGYPDCRFIESLEKPEDTNITCPECKAHTMIKRKSRYGTFFYACSGYPKCRYALRYPPLEEPCPDCKWPILMLKTTKKFGEEKACPQKQCGYKVQISDSN